MGYTLKIGEAVVNDVDWEYFNDGYKLYVSPNIRDEELEEAPAFPNDQMSHHVNSRHPSYSGWAGFARQVGLYGLFFDEEEGLIREHPAVFKLESSHLEKVREALAKYKREHPDATADYELARLLWLEWWMNWALENCEHPAFGNW